MSRRTDESDAARKRRLGTLLPWIVSAALHGTLIVVGFFVVWNVTRAPEDPGPPAVVAFFDPAPAPAPAETATEAQEGEATIEEATPLEPVEIDTPSLDELLAEIDVSAEPAEPAAPTPAQQRLIHDREYPEVRFFGHGAGNAESIVYVVDGSGSMVGTFPMLKEELRRSIDQLAPTQQFQVIFFQGDPSTRRAESRGAPHPSQPERTRETRLIRATRANVSAVMDWIDGVRPAGRSNPIPALEDALALRPDAIFVLSNTITGAGEYEVDAETILARLDELNPAHPITGHRRVAIRTIQFLEEDPSGILRAIGEAHGAPDGYTFITREELGS